MTTSSLMAMSASSPHPQIIITPSSLKKDVDQQDDGLLHEEEVIEDNKEEDEEEEEEQKVVHTYTYILLVDHSFCIKPQHGLVVCCCMQ